MALPSTRARRAFSALRAAVVGQEYVDKSQVRAILGRMAPNKKCNTNSMLDNARQRRKDMLTGESLESRIRLKGRG